MGRNEEKLNALCDEINKNSDNKASFFVADLEKDDIEEIAQKIDKETDGIDILVNNAGIARDSLLLRMTEKDFLNTMNVNLLSIFKLSKKFIRNMIKNKFGRIINISSVVGFTGNAGQTAYTASKAAIIGFTKSLALEVASKNVTANCIAPGFIATQMTKNLKNEIKEYIIEKIPLNRMGLAKEIAAGILYLASQEAAYITGTTLHINGGMYMN